MVLGALWERGSGGSRARPTGVGAWGEADRERTGAGSFGLGQGACNEGRERGSGGPERGRERGSGMLPLGAWIRGPDQGGDASASLLTIRRIDPTVTVKKTFTTKQILFISSSS
jgi:hypothetical protein